MQKNGIQYAYVVCMMKNKTKTQDQVKEKTCQYANRGAALLIALLTAVIVMLAATLLIGLTRRMVTSHQNRIDVAQISLSEASAADGLANLIQEQGLSAVPQNLNFDLVNVATEFSLLETSSTGIRQGFFSHEGADNSIVIPAGNRLVIAESIDATTALISFYSGESFQSTAEFEITTDLAPVAGTPFSFEGKNGVIVLFEGSEKSMLCAVTSEGVQPTMVVEGRIYTQGSHLSGNISSNSNPLLIISSGSGNGTLYDLATGQTQNLSSPGGTSPTFFSDGTVFGSPAGSSINFGGSAVKDIFNGDFNNDGREDIAFASNYSGANGQLFRNAPGGSLVSWGSIDGRMGLCGKWRLYDGTEQWFRLGYDGFTEFSPELAYDAGWSGRFYGSGNTLQGFIEGVASVASSSGYILELFSDGAFTGDVDGADIDFFHSSENGVEAFFNPANGDGVQLTFTANNTYRSRTTLGQTRIFTIYESNGGRRVFYNLEGVKQ